MTTTDKDTELIHKLYGEAQQWARHYESLLVQANVFIIPISLGFLGFAFSTEKASQPEKAAAAIASALLAILGFFLLRMLFGLYSVTVERMIRLETILGCFDAEIGNAIDGNGPLLHTELAKLPVTEPPSVRFFKNVYFGLGLLLPSAFFYLMVFPR
jgi:hypothetical protein